jgi:hypothetical protein
LGGEAPEPHDIPFYHSYYASSNARDRVTWSLYNTFPRNLAL